MNSDRTVEVLKDITCNKCKHKFKSKAQDKNIRCPKCKLNESLSIRY